MATTDPLDLNKLISSEVSSEMFDKVYSKENVVKNYTSLITDLIDQYKSKIDLYDTQKDILFLNDNKQENNEEISNKINLKKRKFYYKEREFRKNSDILWYLQLIGFLLSVTSIILLIFKPLDSGRIV